MNDGILRHGLIDLLGLRVPMPVDGPENDRFDNQPSGGRHIRNAVEASGANSRYQILREKGHESSPCAVKPESTKLGEIDRGPIDQFDPPTTAGDGVVELSHDRLELGSRVDSSPLPKRRRQRRWNLVFRQTGCDVVDGRLGLWSWNWEGRNRPWPLGVGLTADQIEQRLLALDVEVDRPLGDAHRLGNVGHLRPLVATIDEHARRAIDQLIEPVRGNLAGHSGTSIITDQVSQL